MVDVQCLSDNELRKHLKKLGFAPGPIIPSTRKMYEKKLVQLLVSPPCELPVTKRLQKLHGPEDSDDNEDPAVNIVLKGNIKFSKDKVKECKKKPVNELKWQQANTGKSNSGCKSWKMLIKRPEASTNKRRVLDIYYLSQKPTKGGRCAARPIPRSGHRCVTKEDFCQETQNPESSLLCQSPGNSFPWSLKLAILGIFIIVLFVYITIEKKPFLS
ncbi:LEM domain-containing protein 1 [Phodopus roborovskii]|uniref:LEM domain-containing protein 1 n=1 Tax=Phodopus roborovskii TaxID=109678 RepID=UPI0021E4499E|nr:LEM domain-containing protein 1 [Phodopus roborovskii]